MRCWFWRGPSQPMRRARCNGASGLLKRACNGRGTRSPWRGANIRGWAMNSKTECAAKNGDYERRGRSLTRHAAVDAPDRTGRERRRLAREKHGGPGDFFWPRKALYGVIAYQHLNRIWRNVTAHVGGDTPRLDAVDAHGRSEQRCQRFGHGVDPRLGGGIGNCGNFWMAGGAASDVDDRPATVGNHARSGEGTQAEGPLEVDGDDLVE